MTWRTLRHLATATLVVCSSAFVPQALADTADRFQLHGFLAQAAFHTSDNNFNGDSDDGVSTDYNEAGLNASLRLTESLRVAGQIMARNAGNYDNGELRTDYFSVDWQLWRNTKAKAGVRVGRVRNAYGLYNETRDVAHTRPSIYLPGVIYLEQSRDLTISRDGFALYTDVFTDYGTLAIEAGSGRARVSDRLVEEALLGDATGVEARDAETAMLGLNWEDADGHWRFAASHYRITADVDFFIAGEFELTTSLLSAQYSAERWQLTAEYLYFNYDLDFGVFNRRYPGEGAYLQYAWFMSPAWQLYGRYEYGVLDRHHRNGSSMTQFCGGPFNDYCYPRHAGFRRDAGIGLRWDINPNWMIATEAHYLEGTMGVAYSDNPAPLATAPYWTLLGIELAYRF